MTMNLKYSTFRAFGAIKSVNMLLVLMPNKTGVFLESIALDAPSKGIVGKSRSPHFRRGVLKAKRGI
jgi:hypothetical protein